MQERIITYREEAMFNSKKKTETVNTGIINTIIGDNSKIEGVLTASESTRIDGLLEGKIISQSTVIVGEHGVVRGDITAIEILVAGTVYGNLKAEERIELTETGRVLGDLVTKTLVIDEGASFKGNCTMEVMEESALRRARRPASIQKRPWIVQRRTAIRRRRRKKRSSNSGRREQRYIDEREKEQKNRAFIKLYGHAASAFPEEADPF